MDTKVLSLDRDQFDPQALEEAIRLLENNQVVAFPTETVYALGANGDSQTAREELGQLKEKGDESFTIYIADLEEVEKHASPLPIYAQRVIDIYWPGPLTIVVPDKSKGSVGLRMPADPLAQELIRRTSSTLVASSANPTGKDPALNKEDVLKYYRGRIPLVIDGGPTALKQSSTVVSFEGDSWKIQREGIISSNMIKKLTANRILFICTGNSCRSPLAEALFKKMLAQRLNVPPDELDEHGYDIQSAGINAREGKPASQYSVTIAGEHSTDLTHHKTQPATRGLLSKADYIYVMTMGHYQALVESFPDFRNRIKLLADTGIPDPYGGNLEEYRRTAVEIQKSLIPIVNMVSPDANSL